MKIAIIGGGWYGTYTALTLKQRGHDVTIYEKESALFRGISGKFGIRLHAGPHYPRSTKTRENCRAGTQQFLETFPELANENAYIIYGLGEEDANGEVSKVDLETFTAVCKETQYQPIVPETWGFQHLISAMNIKEYSMVGGRQLRDTFTRYLEEAGVKIIYNYAVKNLEKQPNGFSVTDGQTSELFDQIINATSFKDLLPQTPLPYAEVVYQSCLALKYEDMAPNEDEEQFSFIVTEGWYPCIMPYSAHTEEDNDKKIYILTHGKWTILGSFKTVAEAERLLDNLDAGFVETQIKPRCEADIERFWPGFRDRFKYCGFIEAVLAKFKTETEFRSAVTVRDEDGIIQIFPGKVSDIFKVSEEVLTLIQGENLCKEAGYEYVRGGTFDISRNEVACTTPQVRNTCELQTYQEIQQMLTREYFLSGGHKVKVGKLFEDSSDLISPESPPSPPLSASPPSP